MDLTSATSSVLSAFGLSGAAGLNAWIPLLVTGLANRLGLIELHDPYSSLSSTPALIVLAALLVLDFVGDKVPAIDHVLHAIGAVIHPLAGAVVFAAQADNGAHIDPAFALIAGAAISGTLHAGRAGVRPVSSATTAGAGNPVLSAIEDVISVMLTVIAFVAPIIAFLFVVAALVGVAFTARALLRRWRARRRAREAQLSAYAHPPPAHEPSQSAHGPPPPADGRPPPAHAGVPEPEPPGSAERS